MSLMASVAFSQYIYTKVSIPMLLVQSKILEELESNGRIARNGLDASIISRRKSCEKTQILKYACLTHILTGNKFLPLTRKYDQVFRETFIKSIIFFLVISFSSSISIVIYQMSPNFAVYLF